MMDLVLGVLPFCLVYDDDNLIFSKDLPSHGDNLKEVFLLCKEHGLTIGLPKFEFAVSKIEFLEHLLSAPGCLPLQKHSAAISPFPPPSDEPALQRFWGMLNFFRKILRGADGVLASLTDALKGPGKSLAWSPTLDPPSSMPRISLPLFLSSFILALVLRSLLLLMLLIPTWVMFCNSS